VTSSLRTQCGQSDRQLISSGQWLNDRIIDAVNNLPAKRLGAASQTTLLSQTGTGFCQLNEKGVMLLHADAHWVTVAAVNDDIVYMDSMRPHRPITPYVTTQLMQLFVSKVDEDGKLKVQIMPSTPQHNADDCGVYAAAYATEVLLKGVRGVPTSCRVLGRAVSRAVSERRKQALG